MAWWRETDWLRCGSVELFGLNAQEFNGLIGSIKGELTEGRYAIQLVSGKEVRVKPSNLRQHGVSLGIHLGSTVCHVGWVNQSGFLPLVSMESFLAFTPSGRLFGLSAKQQHALNPTNSVPGYLLMGLLGKGPGGFAASSWPSVAKDLGLCIECEEKSPSPAIKVEHRGETKRFGAEELLAMVLLELKSRAESALKGLRMGSVVLSVPASFGDGARKAVFDAVLIADLKLTRMITHTSSNLMSRMVTQLLPGVQRRSSLDFEEDERAVLMIHAGELETDIVTATLEEGVVQVRSVRHMEGGHGFSLHLLKHASQVLGLTEHSNAADYVRLLAQCERATFTMGNTGTVRLEVAQGLDSSVVRINFDDWLALTRAREQLLTFIQEVTSAVSGLGVSEVLVGGVHAKLLMRVLENTRYHPTQLPTDAVMKGAALMATVLNGRLGDILLIDVTSSSLGIEMAGGLMSHIVPKHYTLPCKKTQAFSTFADNQDMILVQLYEGEDAQSSGNQLLSKYSFGGYTRGPRGVPKLEITFEVDLNGICQVSGREVRVGGFNELTVYETTESRLSRQQIEDMRTLYKKRSQREACLWELVRGAFIGRKPALAETLASSSANHRRLSSLASPSSSFSSPSSLAPSSISSPSSAVACSSSPPAANGTTDATREGPAETTTTTETAAITPTNEATAARTETPAANTLPPPANETTLATPSLNEGVTEAVNSQSLTNGTTTAEPATTGDSAEPQALSTVDSAPSSSSSSPAPSSASSPSPSQVEEDSKRGAEEAPLRQRRPSAPPPPARRPSAPPLPNSPTTAPPTEGVPSAQAEAQPSSNPPPVSSQSPEQMPRTRRPSAPPPPLKPSSSMHSPSSLPTVSEEATPSTSSGEGTSMPRRASIVPPPPRRPSLAAEGPPRARRPSAPPPPPVALTRQQHPLTALLTDPLYDARQLLHDIGEFL